MVKNKRRKASKGALESKYNVAVLGILVFSLLIALGLVIQKRANNNFLGKNYSSEQNVSREQQIAESLEHLTKMNNDPKINPSGTPNPNQIEKSVEELEKSYQPASPEEIQASLDALSRAAVN